jgi:PAP2 superfamily protein
MWLHWQTATLAAVVLAAVGFAARSSPARARAVAAGVARESALVLALYAVWQKAGDFAVTRVKGAFGHAEWVWHAERVMHFPSEVSLQRLVLPHPLLVQAMNGYYAIVHVPALIVFLIWLYWRHRADYPRWRNVGALLTGACLLIQMIPVAPPRMLGSLGFVDTGLAYGQSVYGPSGIAIAPQLAAMPSVHVAWAVFIAVVVVACGRGRWKWLVVLHPVLTVLAVVTTANHWWLDGVVAVGLLGVAWVAERSAMRWAHARRPPLPVVLDPAPVLVPVPSDA